MRRITTHWALVLLWINLIGCETQYDRAVQRSSARSEQASAASQSAPPGTPAADSPGNEQAGQRRDARYAAPTQAGLPESEAVADSPLESPPQSPPPWQPSPIGERTGAPPGAFSDLPPSSPTVGDSGDAPRTSRGKPASGQAGSQRPPGSSPPGTGAGYQPGATSLPIRLSAAVALPQTLPTGTAVGFSVDYQFTSGGPETANRYFWVIQAAKAPTAKIPVRLDRQGTLQTFVLEYRPEHGPFSCHIEDYRGNRLSPSISMR